MRMRGEGRKRKEPGQEKCWKNEATADPRSVAAKFEVTAYSKLAPAKISNICIFEYTYVYSNIHGHFVDDYRIWTPFDSRPVNSKLWVSGIFEVMGFVTI